MLTRGRVIISPLNKCVRSHPIVPFWKEAMAFEGTVSIISGNPQRMVQFLRANNGGELL